MLKARLRGIGHYLLAFWWGFCPPIGLWLLGQHSFLLIVVGSAITGAVAIHQRSKGAPDLG